MRAEFRFPHSASRVPAWIFRMHGNTGRTAHGNCLITEAHEDPMCRGIEGYLPAVAAIEMPYPPSLPGSALRLRLTR